MNLPVDYISPLPARDARIWTFPRKVTVLGSTGSIGTSSLKVIAEHPDLYKLIGLAGRNNLQLLAQQAASFRPPFLAIEDPQKVQALKALLPPGYAPYILTGQKGYMELAAHGQSDFVISAQAGAGGLPATLAAVKSGKVIALANKESLVMAGAQIRRLCRATGAIILPVDSEHNAIFQLLIGQQKKPLEIVLTASGGPFFGKDHNFLQTVTPAQTMKHPTWSMGPKISVDSATLMNKGLECIEACHLFGLNSAEISTLIHPQSIVHALVEFSDGSTLAHLARPDMRVPINYCLGYPARPPMPLPRLQLGDLADLTFVEPDIKTFPCLALALSVLEKGEDYGIVLNAANEIAVEKFLNGEIAFTDIPHVISRALERHEPQQIDHLEQVLALDQEVRNSLRGA